MIEVPSITKPTGSVKPVILPKKKNLPKFPGIILKIFSIILTTLVIFAVCLFFLIYIPGQKLYTQALSLKDSASRLKTAVANKDLKDAEVQISDLQSKLVQFNVSYQKLSYFKVLPYAKDYYADGAHAINIGKLSLETGQIVISAIEPYQDFLGLAGSATDSAKTTQDRITFFTQSVEGLVPHLDTIDDKLAQIETELNQIDANRYPDQIKNYQIKSNILLAKQTVSEVHQLVKNSKPILTKTSWLLGNDKPRNYFLIFQNNAELRPTGGFWTAYGTLTVDKGKITPGLSGNIYDLDALYNSTVPAPRPIKAYHINVPYLNLRDMNLSPDFPTSIESFMAIYYKITNTKTKFDAVIGIDTQVLVDLLKVLGRLGAGTLGNISADPDKRCDGCPEIIYQIEWEAGQPRNYIDANRKGFLGPLIHTILSNALGAEKSKIGPLAQAAFNDIMEKHVLFYFTDPTIQQAAVTAGIAGSITQTDANTDYFHLNDANFASAKTNLFLTQKIKHEIIVDHGKVEHKVTVTYTNPDKASNCNLEKGGLCLNAPKYRDWFRFYVPQGSQLVKMTGSEVTPVLYDELGKSVFEGFYGDKYPLYAQSSAKTSVQYISSVPASANYTLLLQKQPGTKAIPYELWVNGKLQESFSWTGDKTIKLSL
jgi:hypothetical protein